eukprot:6113502-Prymnesium_polylepis.1
MASGANGGAAATGSRVHLALADFEPKHPSELRMEAGAVMVVHGERDGWALASEAGAGDARTGLVPSDHLLPAYAAKAIANFTSEHEKELSLSKGEHVWVMPALTTTASGWRNVVNEAGEQGLVPRSHLLRVTLTGSNSEASLQATSPRAPLFQSPVMTMTALEDSSAVASTNGGTMSPSTSVLSPDIATTTVVAPAAAGSLALVLADFVAEASGELSVRRGER